MAAEKLQLRVVPPAFGLPTGCPRCLSSVLYLRLAGAGFRAEYCSTMPDSDDLPVAEIGEQAGFSCEAGGVEEFLRREAGYDLDAELTELERSELRAFKSLLLSLQDAVSYELWSAGNEEVAAQIYTSQLPWPLTKVIEWDIRRKVMDRFGVSKETLKNREAEIYRCAFSAYDALEAKKQSDSFFLSEKPTSLDAVLLAHLLFILTVPLQGSKLREELQEKHPELVRYAESKRVTLLKTTSTSANSDLPNQLPRSASRRASTNASSSKSSSRGAKAEPKREKTAKEKEFARKGKMFLAAQLIATVGFLIIFGLNPESDEND